MFSTNFKGSPVFILNDSWNGNSDFKLDAAMIRDDQQSLTKREGRRPYSETVLCHCQYQVTLQHAAVRAAIGSLRQYNTQKVIIPLWPAVTYWVNRNAPGVQAGLRLAFKQDWSQYALYASTDAEPGWPLPNDLFTPALMGFVKPTQQNLLTPDDANWDIDFQESSSAAYAIKFTDVVQDVTGAAIQDTSGNAILGF